MGDQNDIELLGQVSCSPGALTLSFRARERKLRTRRLILMGSYREHVTQDDPERFARLMKELDGFLECPQDRELFGLQPRLDPGLQQGE